MNPLSVFCLSAIVFLSLPLPLFASAAIAVSPSLRRSMMPWVWVNATVGSITGLLIIATSFQPFVAVAVASFTFVLCGTRMFQTVSHRCASLK